MNEPSNLDITNSGDLAVLNPAHSTPTSTLFKHGTISQYIKIYYLQKQLEKVVFQ
jgi:hypothetical protein